MENYSGVVSNPVTTSINSLNGEIASQVLPRPQVRQDGRYERGGKRWVRRQDNSKFVGNRHIVKPSSKDFELSWSSPRTTFPKPLPPFISRRISAPSASVSKHDPVSAKAGRYSLSLKGIRKELRRSGPTAEQMILDIEQELTEWLLSASVLLSPDVQQDPLAGGTIGKNIGFSNSIWEISRTPTELIWRIDEDFPRFLLHCVARFHNVVSFSKAAPSGEGNVRLTHLLRPNVIQPDFGAINTLDTPPASDVDSISILADTDESDFDVMSRLGPVAEDDIETRSEVSYGLIENHLEERRDLSNYRVLSRLPSRERKYEASVEEVYSSLGRDESELLVLSTSVKSLSIEEGGVHWDSTPRRRGPGPNKPPSGSPIRPVDRVDRWRSPLISVESRLQFWRFIFG